MTRLAVVALLLLGLTTCTRSSFRVGEGVFCSTDGDDEPFYVCNVSLGDLICIQTYAVRETKAYVCRKGCDSADDCVLTGDVCCMGPTEGRTFGYERACVPKGQCTTDPMPLDKKTEPPKGDAMMSRHDDAGTPRPTTRDATPGDVPSQMSDAMSSIKDANADGPATGDAADASRD